MTGSRAPEALNAGTLPEGDPGLEAVELAARISRRLSAGDTPTTRHRLPTPRPPASST